MIRDEPESHMAFSRSLLAAVATLALTGAASAQTPPAGAAPGYADPYAHDPYITGTGATVANPGKSQSGGTTPQERAIQRQDNAIDRSICKGC